MANDDDPPTETEEIQGALQMTIEGLKEVTEMPVSFRTVALMRSMNKMAALMIDALAKKELGNSPDIAA